MHNYKTKTESHVGVKFNGDDVRTKHLENGETIGNEVLKSENSSLSDSELLYTNFETLHNKYFAYQSLHQAVRVISLALFQILPCIIMN